MNHYHEPSSCTCFSIPSAIRGLRVKPAMTMVRGLRVKPAMTLGLEVQIASAMTIEKKTQKNFFIRKILFSFAAASLYKTT